MARVVTGCLVPVTTTPGQTIISTVPEAGIECCAMQCGGWIRTYTATASRLGVVSLNRDEDVKMEFPVQQCLDMGGGGVLVIPTPDLIFTGESIYAWALLPPHLVTLNTFWHAGFFFTS